MILLLAILLSGASPTAPDTIVVCPAEFRAALAPWVAYRTSEGHRIEFASNELTAAELRSVIRDCAKRGSLRYVVLVGDAAPPDRSAGQAPADVRDARARTVPTWQAVAKVIPRYGGEATIATDNAYADLDDDAIPEVAVGRLTAHSPAELARIVEKILAYERSTDFGPWRRQVNLVAGAGGFGALADAAIEAAARRVLAAGVPGAYATRITYGNWRSPFCPDPRRFRAAAIDSLDEGSLCWVYVGHGWPDRLADLRVGGHSYPTLERADFQHVRSRHGAPIACLLACYTGAFDGPSECLAEAMLGAPGAPVAVICGSRVTMPYAMAVLGTELLEQIFERRPESLGQAFVTAKRRMVAPTERSNARSGLDALAALLNPGASQEELTEHLHLFNLVGDPLLRLKLPEPTSVYCERQIKAGTELNVAAASPITGRATIELVPRRDLLSFRPPARPEFTGSAEQLAEMDETYRRANDPCLARIEMNVDRGELVGILPIPGMARGPWEVRIFIAGTQRAAAGSTTIEVLPASASDPGAATRSKPTQ